MARLFNGEVVLVQGGMNIVGGVQHIRDAILAEVQGVAGPEVAEALRAAGLVNLHKVLTAKQLNTLHGRVTPIMVERSPAVTEALTRTLFGRRKFWINRNVALRFLTPNTMMKDNYELLKRKTGKLVQHGPHHDYWQGVALNALNLWIAIERVDRGNAMIINAERWGDILPRDGEHVSHDQKLGVPIVTACDAGDIILFHSQHLHGGILNRTDETRIVISTRVAMSAPMHPRLGGGTVYVPAFIVRGGSKRLAAAFALLERLRPINLLRRIEMHIVRRRGKGRPGDENLRVRLFDGVLKRHWFPRIADHGIAPDATDEPPPRTALDGQIIAIGKNRIRVTSQGRTFELSRRCTHQGGDMACGYLREGKIHCPLHDQPFDLETGQAEGPGAGLAPLKVHETADV